MSERNFEQFNHEELEDQPEAPVEFSEIEKDALEKVVNFENQTNIGITSLGFGKIGKSTDAHFLSGLLNTERVLNMGLLPRNIAQRANLPVSQYGHPENEPPMTDREAKSSVYAFQLNRSIDDDYHPRGQKWNFSIIKDDLARYYRFDKDYSLDRDDSEVDEQQDDNAGKIKSWFLVIDLENEDTEDNILYSSDKFTHESTKEDWGVKITGRVKPEKILGIVVDEEMVNLDIKDYFSSLNKPEGASSDYDHRDFSWYRGKKAWYGLPPDEYRGRHTNREEGYYWEQKVKNLYSKRQMEGIAVLNSQLADTLRILDIELAEAEYEVIGKLNEDINLIESNFQDLERKYSDATRYQEAWKGGDLDFPVQKALASSKVCELKLKVLDIYVKKILGDPRFAGISTLSKYLSELGEKFKIPVYYLHKKTKEELEAENESFNDNTLGLSKNKRELAIFNFQNTRQYHSAGLFWPQQMDPQELKEYIRQH